MRRLFAAFLLLPFMAAPALAEVVTLKDGTQLNGTITPGPQALLVRVDGKEQTVPYADVQGISLDDKPLYPPPGPLMGHEWLAWSALGADAIALALVAYEASR